MDIKKTIVCILVFFYCIDSCKINAEQRNKHDIKAYSIAVLGAGYVGLITGACFAEFGHSVTVLDTEKHKIDLLNANTIPIYEPGLKELIEKNVKAGRLFFSHDINSALEAAQCIFVAVGTPMSADGYADLTAIDSAFEMIIEHLHTHKIICIKSTVPIGTGDTIIALLQERGIGHQYYDLVSNPEFLREGSAIHDFMNPDRIVVGTYSDRARNYLQDIYDPLIQKMVPCIFTSIASAETIKYAANAFLATKVSFINEIANLCDQTGADIVDVAFGMGLDKRIGHAFLKPGPGFGGSCFPKDCYALANIAKNYNVQLNIVSAVLVSNEMQKKKPVEKLLLLMNGSLKDKTIALLGLAFKGNTDDIRHSAAIDTIQFLLEEGATIKVYDPVAMENMKKLFPQLEYANSVYDAAYDVHAVIIMTEWEEFKTIDLEKLGSVMREKIIVDARNLLDPVALQQHDFSYAMMGRP